MLKHRVCFSSFIVLGLVACNAQDPSSSGAPSANGGLGSSQGGSGGALAVGGSGSSPASGGALGGAAPGAGGIGGLGASNKDHPCPGDPGDFATRSTAELFDSPSIPTFDLRLPEDAWANLKVHARDEEFVEAQACFNGKGIGTVGLRFKGSYGSLYNCFNAAGVNTCRKLGMKIKFNETVPDQRFYGLKRLNFQGYHWDDTYLKERLAYDLYRDMGIGAPRAAWALLRVNGEDQGLFGMVEQIDGRYTKDRWPSTGEGNLFKEAWPGAGDAVWAKAHLETNTNTADVSDFLAFSEALNAASDDGLRSVLGRYVDLDQLSRYMAVDDAIANFDGVTTYYTNGIPEENGNHNFYIYQESPERFTFIPWDLESTLSLLGKFGSVPSWQSKPQDCSLTYPVWSGTLKVVAPGCNRVFRGLAADLGTYRAAGRELLDGPFALDRLLAKIDRLAAFIRPQATADIHGPGAALFERSLGFLKEELPRLRARFEHILSGEPTVPLELDIHQTANFESVDDYGPSAGTFFLTNPASLLTVGINTATPIDGAKSLRLQFEFGNEAEAWQQWLQYSIPVASPPGDVSGFSGVKFKVRSDRARVLRVDLDSPRNSAGAAGVQPGWDIPITTEVQEISVVFSTAKIPSWAKDPGDDLTGILQAITALNIKPQCAARDGSGQIPEGASDKGWVDMDDIEFF